MSNAITLKNSLENGDFKNWLAKSIGKRSDSVASNLLTLAHNDKYLAMMDAEKVYGSVLLASSLNLSLDKNLGQVYLIPYKGQVQFQLGYKGLYQLALRTGKFLRVDAVKVYKGQLLKIDPINGYEFDWGVPYDENDTPAGYYAFFKLKDGFTSELYLSREELIKHAMQYSQSFGNASGAWKKSFDAMALKTVLKLLLSRKAPLTTELQEAITADQAEITQDGRKRYIDNPDYRDDDVIEATVVEVDERQQKIDYIAQGCKDGLINLDSLLAYFKCGQLEELQTEQLDYAIAGIEKRKRINEYRLAENELLNQQDSFDRSEVLNA